MQKFVVGIEEVILKKFETFAENEDEAEKLTIRKYFGGIKPLSQEITCRNSAILEPEEGDWNEFYED